MPREIRDEVRDLLDSGNFNRHTTFDITLNGGLPLFLSTGQIHVDRFGKDTEYEARLIPAEVGPLEMSTDIEADGQSFGVSNVDLVTGQTFTGVERVMDGASAVSGVLFIDRTLPLEDAIWDAKMPGQLMASEVRDQSVPFSFVSEIDAVLVSGRTIASEFQWQEPTSNVPTSDPDDLPRPGTNPDPNPTPGRLPPVDPSEIPYMPDRN